MNVAALTTNQRANHQMEPRVEEIMYSPSQMIDTHQHLWLPSERKYEWLEVAGPPLNVDFGPDDVTSGVTAAGVTGTVLVQAADTYEDTFYMLSVAKNFPIVKGVVGWVPLDRAAEAEAALDTYSASSLVVGIRVLNHDYGDPRWLLTDAATRGISLLAPRNLSLDVVSTCAEHLVTVAEVAKRHPSLKIVIDHLGGPDIAHNEWEPWSRLMIQAAEFDNVHVKLSGLSTLSSKNWSPEDWQPYVDHALHHFGPSRMMIGSDWPVSTQRGKFEDIWTAHRSTIESLSEQEKEQILFRNAVQIYDLES